MWKVKDREGQTLSVTEAGTWGVGRKQEGQRQGCAGKCLAIRSLQTTCTYSVNTHTYMHVHMCRVRMYTHICIRIYVQVYYKFY